MNALERISPAEYTRRYADACVKADVVPGPVLTREAPAAVAEAVSHGMRRVRGPERPGGTEQRKMRNG